MVRLPLVVRIGLFLSRPKRHSTNRVTLHHILLSEHTSCGTNYTTWAIERSPLMVSYAPLTPILLGGKVAAETSI
jgi:hypothetical protein